MHEIAVVPDFAFGLKLADSPCRYFMVQIDRGTMPVVRLDIFKQTSFAEKMRAYLTAHVAKQHERRFGWKTFRVLTVTTDERRKQIDVKDGQLAVKDKTIEALLERDRETNVLVNQLQKMLAPLLPQSPENSGERG